MGEEINIENLNLESKLPTSPCEGWYSGSSPDKRSKLNLKWTIVDTYGQCYKVKKKVKKVKKEDYR